MFEGTDFTWWYLRFKGCTSGLQMVPKSIYIALLVIYAVGTVFYLLKNGYKRSTRKIALLLQIEYTIVLYCAIVFYRVSKEVREFDLRPFWSYKAFYDGQTELLMENAMNVVAFFPIGFLLGVSIKGIRWWHILLYGLCVSIGLEILQYALMRGLAEVDDVMHNALGCMMGCWMVCIFRKR